MARTPARFTQADIARATRAAIQAGAAEVLLTPDGSIRILLSPLITDGEKATIAPGQEIVL